MDWFEVVMKIIGGEEYEWENPKTNRLQPLSYDDCCDELENMDEKDIRKLGFNNEEDIWDFVNQEYTITE